MRRERKEAGATISAPRWPRRLLPVFALVLMSIVPSALAQVVVPVPDAAAGTPPVVRSR